MMLQIKHRPTGNVMEIYSFWLRDHCRCDQCYNWKTKQRRYNLLDIPANVKPLETAYVGIEEMQYAVKWDDGHSSKYCVQFLYDSQVQQLNERKRKSLQRTPWDRSVILQNEHYLRVKISDLISTDSAVKELVSSLIRYGLVFIDEVPPNPTMTEMAIRRVFPTMKTLFGEMYTFSDEDTVHADTAYTKEYLGSHTDNTYFTDAAGLQALHCIRHVDGEGGENFFVDGLHAALELKRRNREAFDMLSRVAVPAEYIEDGQHHTHSAPMIRLDQVTGEIVQLRLNVYDRSVFNTIPQHEMAQFYQSFREYLAIVQSASNQWKLKMHPGSIVIFDNWRVYHGRYAYTGQRTMTGAYVQRTDYMSKARVLGLID